MIGVRTQGFRVYSDWQHNVTPVGGIRYQDQPQNKFSYFGTEFSRKALGKPSAALILPCCAERLMQRVFGSSFVTFPQPTKRMSDTVSNSQNVVSFPRKAEIPIPGTTSGNVWIFNVKQWKLGNMFLREVQALLVLQVLNLDLLRWGHRHWQCLIKVMYYK